MYFSELVLVYFEYYLFLSISSILDSLSLSFFPSSSKWSSIFCPCLFYSAIYFDFLEIWGLKSF